MYGGIFQKIRYLFYSGDTLRRSRSGLLQMIEKWKGRDWRVVFAHVCCEGNRAMDCLASVAMKMEQVRDAWMSYLTV